MTRRWRLPDEGDGLGTFAAKPWVDIDRNDRIWLTFEDGRASGSDVVLAREVESSWDMAIPSLGLGDFHQDARVAAYDDDHAILVWNRSGAFLELQNEVRVGAPGGRLVEPPGGGRFSFAPYAIQNEVQAHPDGEVFLTWNQGLDDGGRRGICIANRFGSEADFHRPKNQLDVVSRSFIFSNNPEVARNTRGDTVVTWFESFGERLRVASSERYGLDGRFTIANDADALSPPEGDVEDPEPAVAEDGRAVIVWRQVLPSGKMAVFMSERPNRGAWSRPSMDEPFSEVVDNAWHTRVAFAPGGDLYVVWEQKIGTDWSVMLAHRAPDGRWLASGKEALRLSGQPAIDPVLRVAADGTVVVAWRARFGTHWRVMERHSAVDAEGATEAERWSAAVALSPIGRDAGAPAIAVARHANARGHRVVVAWSHDGQIFRATLD
ncbi:MAG: hypothetical protein FJ096_08860 [Deltaproteobacteria bacterium]|nr:hypothetical protein [Deltaproteobacteria bacterium]